MTGNSVNLLVTEMLVLGGLEAVVLLLFIFGAAYFFYQLFRPKTYSNLEVVERLKKRLNKEQGNDS
jgi:hypothetical protein